MKVAIIGSNPTTRKEVVDKLMQKWTNFACPERTIEDEITKEEVDEMLGFYQKRAEMGASATLANDIEEELFRRALLIEGQMRRYKSQKNVLFCGCIMDVLLEAILLHEKGLVSDELLDKLVLRNKKVLKDLDLVMMVRVNKTEENWKEDEEDEKRLEMLYRNYLDKYFHDGDKSNLFPPAGAAMECFQTEDPVSEFGDIVDDHGNLAEVSRTPKEIDRLLKLFGGKSKNDVLKIMQGGNEIRFKDAFPNLSNSVEVEVE